MICTPAERAALARLNAASIERSFVPARDVPWTDSLSSDEWRALYAAWSLFPGSRFEACFNDETRARFARYQQATLMLVTATLERHALPLLEGLLHDARDAEFVEYVGHFIKEETYHYVMFLRAIEKIEGEMPAMPPLPRSSIERMLACTSWIVRRMPGRRFRTSLAFAMFQFAERVSIEAHRVARVAVPRKDAFVPQVWALHAIDEARHLQFDRMIIEKLRLSGVARTFARGLAGPLCIAGTVAVHRTEAWAARQLGVPVRLWDLLKLLRAPVSPFKQRIVALMREVAH